MHYTAILVATIFCTFVSSQEYAVSAQCGCLEVPATSSRQRDRFCRPHLTDPSERRKHRSCVCRLGLVRNSWGDCITKQECTSCKCFRDRDFNVCGRECPLVCNEPINRSCSKSCAFGCDCLPGFVRNSRMRGRCVKAAKCALTCPPFSRFEFCRSTCAPKCGRRPRRTCVTRCRRGDCVCNVGYAEVEHNGETICVPQNQCSRYLQLAAPMTQGGNASIGGGVMPGGPVHVPGTPSVSVNPEIVTGSTSGTAVPGSVGISGASPIPGVITGGSGGSVFITGTPSVPETPGVVTGSTPGTPVPGSVVDNGNIGGRVNSGGPNTPAAPLPPVVVTGGTAGPSVPGSAGISGALRIPGVVIGGTGIAVTSGGSGNQSGSTGTGSGLPGPGVGGRGSLGTYPHGGAVNRPPGSTDTQGLPSRGTSGFGSVGGSISSSGIGPQDSMESGEDSGVAPAGIPQHPGGNPTGGAPAATGTLPSSGISGTGIVSAGLQPHSMPPKVTIPAGRQQPPYNTTIGSAAGVGAGGSVYGSSGLPFPRHPGTNIAGANSAGNPVIWPNSKVTHLTPTPVQGTPGSPSLTGHVTNVTSGVVSTVPSGVPLPPGVPTAGVVVVSNGVPSNGGNVLIFPGTNMASTLSSTVAASTPSPVVIRGVNGSFIGSMATGVAGGGLATASRPSPTTSIFGRGAVAVNPGSGSLGGGGSLTAVGKALSSGLSSGTLVAAPSAFAGTPFPSMGPSPGSPSEVNTGVSGSGTTVSVTTTGTGVSVTNHLLTNRASSSVPATTAAAIGGVQH